MNKLVTSVLAATVAAAAAVSLARPPQTTPPIPGAQMIVERFGDLNLTDQQTIEIAAVREEFAPKIDSALDRLDGTIKEQREAASAVLTADQKIKLLTLKTELGLWRTETIAERYAHLRELDLTDAEKAKINDIRKEFRPKIVKCVENLKGILTPDQLKMREDMLKTGMPRRDVIKALKLTDDQKTKVEAIGDEVRGYIRNELDRVRAVLDPAQREKIAAMKEDRIEQFRARALFAIASLKDLNLTDQQVQQLRAIHAEYGARVEDAGNQVRALIREELSAIVNVLQD